MCHHQPALNSSLASKFTLFAYSSGPWKQSTPNLTARPPGLALYLHILKHLRLTISFKLIDLRVHLVKKGTRNTVLLCVSSLFGRSVVYFLSCFCINNWLHCFKFRRTSWYGVWRLKKTVLSILSENVVNVLFKNKFMVIFLTLQML